MANKRLRKNQSTSITDAEEEAPTAALSKDVEDQIAAAIRAMRDLETNRLLTSLRLLSSYFTEEQLQTPVLDGASNDSSMPQFFSEQLQQLMNLLQQTYMNPDKQLHMVWQDPSSEDCPRDR